MTITENISPATTPRLSLEHVGKSFGPVTVLRDISFTVARGEFVGLIGENGAGKSTLLNILSGVTTADHGSVLLDGEAYSPSNYHEATKQGVFRIFQELALAPNLTVYENLYLSHERHLRKAGLLDKKRMLRMARELLDRFDHGWIDARKLAGDYPFAVRQVLEVLKAFALAELLQQPHPVLLLDEPTAGLAQEEIDFLEQILHRVRSDASIVFVSHRLSELISWSERILVMKDGVLVADRAADAMNEDELHFLMVGRERDRDFYHEDRQRIIVDAVGTDDDSPLLQLTGASVTGSFNKVDLSIRKGEIIGLGGVLGSGKTEVGRAVAGDLLLDEGSVAFKGSDIGRLNLRQRQQRSIGYIPPERKREGIIDNFSVSKNISFSRITTGGGGSLLDLARETKDAHRFVRQLSIKTDSINQQITRLSGGNQQKCILARWLARPLELLILDNPTRGVDAGAKEDIYAIIRELAANDVAILLISDDLLELIGMSNEIVIMKDGEITRRQAAPVSSKPTEFDLVSAMV